MTEHIIPVFPLHLVVFPHSFYPLHIFEERYKIMVNDAFKNKSPIGIVPTVDTIPSSIGTTVYVSQITNKYANGEFDIIVKGSERFKVLKSWPTATGFGEALVEIFNDTSDNANLYLVDELEKKFKDLLQKANVDLEENFWKNLHIVQTKSFKIAEKSGLSLDQQIELLSKQEEEDRIQYLLLHLNKMEKTMEQRSSFIDLLMNDGYLNN